MVDLYKKRMDMAKEDDKESNSMGYQLALIKSSWISECCNRKELEHIIEKLVPERDVLQERIKQYRKEAAEIEYTLSELISEKEDLTEQLKNISKLNITAHKRTTERLYQVQEQLYKHQSKLISLKEAYGYLNPSRLIEDEDVLETVAKRLKTAENELTASKNRENNLHNQYINKRKSIPARLKKTVIKFEIKYLETMVNSFTDLAITMFRIIETIIENEIKCEEYIFQVSK